MTLLVHTYDFITTLRMGHPIELLFSYELDIIFVVTIPESLWIFLYHNTHKFLSPSLEIKQKNPLQSLRFVCVLPNSYNVLFNRECVIKAMLFL